MKDIKAVFDIGNDFIKAVVFANDNDKDVILAKQMEPTHGMRKGKVLDTAGFTNTINKITESFIKKLGGDFIDDVYIGISHPEAKITRVTEQKRIMRETIENDDIDHLSKVVADIAQHHNHETIKIVPVYWIVDEAKKEKDPIGLQGKKLELVADVFSIPKNFYNTILDTFDRVGLSVADVIPNIIASSEIAIDYDHKDLGTLFIDIGKNQTSYVIYEEGFPLGYGTIPIGGEDITKDISIGLQIDIKEAENIKKNQGVILFGKQGGKSDDALDIHFLSDVISARYEEIFFKVADHLQALDRDGRLPGGVILSGGAVKMENLDLLAKDVFKLATFFAKDQQLHLGDISSNLQFINVLGLYVRANKYSEGKRGALNMSFDIIGNIGKFFKDLF